MGQGSGRGAWIHSQVLGSRKSHGGGQGPDCPQPSGPRPGLCLSGELLCPALPCPFLTTFCSNNNNSMPETALVRVICICYLVTCCVQYPRFMLTSISELWPDLAAHMTKHVRTTVVLVQAAVFRRKAGEVQGKAAATASSEPVSSTPFGRLVADIGSSGEAQVSLIHTACNVICLGYSIVI